MPERQGLLNQLSISRYHLSGELNWNHFASLADQSTIRVTTAERRQDRWVVTVHDGSSSLNFRIEVLNSYPQLRQWARKAIGYEHEPGKIARFQRLANGKMEWITNPNRQLEEQIVTSLATAMHTYPKGEPSDSRIWKPFDAWKRLRSILFNEPQTAPESLTT